MACPKRVLEPLTEVEHDEMIALFERAHHHGQLGLQSPPANKKQNRAASPTPVTTGQKATRRRDELGDRAHEIYYASDSQKAQHFAKMQRPQSTEMPAKSAKSAAEKASAAMMARWDEHERRVQAARGRLPVDHGYIDLSLPALVRAERSARAVPRQMRLLPPTCAKVHKRYYMKLVGDSPELCRGLDSHGTARSPRTTRGATRCGQSGTWVTWTRCGRAWPRPG
jgi:hypothetical protein